ncbi:MAG: hypothetical protein QOD37_791 [Gaiellales bacterium]|nr:hypothetical protein [Gaiellales bacterium]
MHTHPHDREQPSLNALAFSATVHCLTGCAIGEVLGMVLGTAIDWTPPRPSRDRVRHPDLTSTAVS